MFEHKRPVGKQEWRNLCTHEFSRELLEIGQAVRPWENNYREKKYNLNNGAKPTDKNHYSACKADIFQLTIVE